MFDFFITALAVFRISVLLTMEDGPYSIFKRIRHYFRVLDEFEGEYQPSLIAGILSCLWCCSVWVGGFFAIVPVPMVIKQGLALSSAAILINSLQRFLGNRP